MIVLYDSPEMERMIETLWMRRKSVALGAREKHKRIKEGTRTHYASYGGEIGQMAAWRVGRTHSWIAQQLFSWFVSQRSLQTVLDIPSTPRPQFAYCTASATPEHRSDLNEGRPAATATRMPDYREGGRSWEQ